ncbi:hypothetical protein [Rhodopseudomonas sp. P2A-2r]|uniref:hypothetical protein n=1 Tax=unclassified Rhodopseudomonas TaxID=2638247 RepID=UPI00223467EF|nr:hypothetical protein [Rhodopseudomonas sp. P2A-2r]UZE51396.1 hypothetical protein ONR75_12755 [Rhodopseudomonas sp. P2A-2r]
MDEISKQQILEMLYEIHDGMDRMDAKLHENLVLLRTINYEMELGLQQIAQARSSYSERVASS